MIDHSHLPKVKADWDYSVYSGIKEDTPDNLPTPRGKPMRLTTYVDANLMHFLNSTPIEWFSKKQSTVEAATYGSEFMAARIAVQQIIDIRMTLRYMGIPLEGPAWLLGDNEGVLKSSTIPASVLKKRHNALSYHTVRAAIAAGFVEFRHIPGEINPADMLTKNLAAKPLDDLARPLLFWRGLKIEWRKPTKKEKKEKKEESD